MMDTKSPEKVLNHIFKHLIIKEQHKAFQKSRRNIEVEEQIIYYRTLVRADSNRFYLFFFVMANSKYFNHFISVAILVNAALQSCD
jgi:hypothetical protein